MDVGNKGGKDALLQGFTLTFLQHPHVGVFREKKWGGGWNLDFSSSGYFLWFHNFLFWNAIHDILTQSQCYLKYIYGKWDQDELCSSKIQEQRYGWRHTCQSKFILAMAKNCFARPSEKLKLQIDRYFSFNFFG